MRLDKIAEVSEVLGSKKRTLLLFLLSSQPLSYSSIEKGFRKMNISIGSSEIYKHLNVLMKHNYIVKNGRSYFVTLKGKKLIESLEEVTELPPKIPKFEMVF